MSEATFTPRVLVVDDNEAHSYALAHMLRARGARVRQARTAQEALELAVDNTDVMLLDIHLPDMTGYALLERLRQDPRTASLPVILASAVEPAGHARSTAQALGVAAFLTLPVIPDDLWIVVQATINRSQTQRKPAD